jgi:hypothetical protein
VHICDPEADHREDGSRVSGWRTRRFDPRHFLAKGPGIVSFDWLSLTTIASAKAAQSSYEASVADDGFAAVFADKAIASAGKVCVTSEVDRTLIVLHLRKRFVTEQFNARAADFDRIFIQTFAFLRDLSVSTLPDLEATFRELK